jgi:PIN domain nuclease of toxin-antitoxin system
LNGFLLDTNIAILATTAPETLPPRVRLAIETGPAYLSVVSYWEVMIKAMKQVFEVGDPVVWFNRTKEDLGLRQLLLRPEHVSAVFLLPPIHQDPFDRVLIGQAIAEQLTLLTTDAVMERYASKSFLVIR